MIAASLSATSWPVVAQELTLIRMAVRPCHCVTPRQHVPSRCTASITWRVALAEGIEL